MRISDGSSDVCSSVLRFGATSGFLDEFGCASLVCSGVAVASARSVMTPPRTERIRIRFDKWGRIRFTSHRDVARELGRAASRERVGQSVTSKVVAVSLPKKITYK